MTLWTALRRTYRQSWRFLVALPILAAAVVGFEGVQHLVEWSDGMDVSGTAARAAENAPGRMISGSLKIAWLLVLQYWVARFIVTGGSTRQTLAFEPVSVRKFAWVFLYGSGISLVILFLPDFLPSAGSIRRTGSIALLVFALATFPIGIALTPWAVAAAVGDSRASPLFALRRAGGSILWGVVVEILAVLPLMVVHYGLGLGATGQAPRLAVPMLVLDTVCVGFLGIVINASQVIVAERMMLRAGEAFEYRQP